MVKRILQAAALAGVMSLSPVVAAHAAQVCTTGSLLVCVDFSLSTASGGNFALQVTYTSSNAGGTLTDFGVDPSTGFTFAPVSVSGSGSFSTGTNCSLQDDACASANPPAPTNGLHVGQTATLTFSATGGFSSTNFASTLYNAHIQAFTNLPNCSVKLGNGSQFSTQGTGGSFNADAASCNVTATPEPASLFLLGTGLLGLSGGAVVRRRRKDLDA